MIFISENEKGEPAWELVLNGRKTVTRRVKPVEEGKTLAIQPGRGKKSLGRVLVTSVIRHDEWLEKVNCALGLMMYSELEAEAEREGFASWHGLMKWFTDRNIDVCDTFRIEMELIT